MSSEDTKEDPDQKQEQTVAVASNDVNQEEQTRVRRHEYNPQDVLKWVIKETAVPKAGPDDLLPISETDVTSLFSMPEEERQKWIDIILGKAPGTISEDDQLKAILASLQKADSMEDDVLMPLLEELKFMVELTHFANRMHQAGALRMVVDLLWRDHEGIREMAAWVLQSCIPNNTKFQTQMMELAGGGVPLLLERARVEKSDAVLYKLWGAIAGMVRSFDPGADAFISLGGFSDALKALDAGDEKVQRRLAFLFGHFFEAEARVTADLMERSHALTIILPNLTNPDTSVREDLAAGLLGWAEREEQNLAFLNLYAKDVAPCLKAAQQLARREGDKDFSDTIAKLQARVKC